MIDVILHTKMLRDQIPNSLSIPKVVGIAVGFGSFEQQFSQLAQLVGVEFRGPARLGFGIQGLATFALEVFFPSIDSLGMKIEKSSNVLDTFALLKQGDDSVTTTL